MLEWDYHAMFTYELHIVSHCVFFVGVVSLLESKDFLNVLLNLEVIMLGISFNIITTSIYAGDYMGQVYVMCFLAVSAAEAVIGLSIVVLVNRTYNSLKFTKKSTLV